MVVIGFMETRFKYPRIQCTIDQYLMSSVLSNNALAEDGGFTPNIVIL